MKFLTWFGFILICLDTFRYIKREINRCNDIYQLIGTVIGTVARLTFLVGAAVCWMLS